MKTLKSFGLLGILSLVMLSTACKKSPNKALYKSWALTSATLEDVDQTTLDAMIADGVTYTFTKDGNYTRTMGGETASGTFETNKEATQITTTEDGNVTAYTMILNEDNLTLRKGSEEMNLKAK